MSTFSAFSSILSPSWMSMARLVLPSRLELKRRAGSANEAPLAKVIFTTLLYVSPVQMIPACDHTGTPLHFHSSTTSGSARLMRIRTRASVSPRQSPSSLILASISREAEFSPFPSFEPFLSFMNFVAFFIVVVARPLAADRQSALGTTASLFHQGLRFRTSLSRALFSGGRKPSRTYRLLNYGLGFQDADSPRGSGGNGCCDLLLNAVACIYKDMQSSALAVL